MKKPFLLIFSFLPLSALAQAGVDRTFLFEDTNFFVCIVAGVLLALGFQLLLTALSVAAGISAVGDVREKSHSSSSDSNKNKDSDDDGGMNVVQKISTALGIWTLVTTSIALFFASMLAVKLGFIGVNFVGATLGLVIWATFFMVVTYLEVNMISSLVGGLVSTVKSSLSSVFSVFSKSEESVAKDVAKTRAKEEAKATRKELEKLFSTHDVDKKIEDYVQQLKPQQIDIKEIKKHLKDLFTDLKVTEKTDWNNPDTIKKMILEEADNSALSKEDKQAIKDHVSGLKDIVQSDASTTEKIKAGIEELTPADKEQIEKYQREIRKALKNTNNRELQPEKLEQDLKRILDEPKQATNIAKSKASAMDRDTLVQLLASQDMSEQEANHRVEQVEKVLNKVKSLFGEVQDKTDSKMGDLQDKKEDLQAKIKGMFTSGASNLEQIYSDFTSIFQETGAGPDVKYKLEHYNEEEMTRLITNKTSLSRSEAEPIAAKIVSARDYVLNKVYEVQIKVNEKIEEAKEKALIAAEETRKAAATAAWWLVATAVVSAAASAVGGMLALESFF